MTGAAAAPETGRARRTRLTVRYWLTKLVMSAVVRAYLRVSFDDRERLPDGPAIYCFNHLSWTDPFMLLATLPGRPRLFFFGPKEEDMAAGGRNRLMTWTGTAIPYKPAKTDLREATLSKGTGYLLYTIVDDAFASFFPMLRKIGLKLDSIEEDIFIEEESREVVRDISNVKQEIINFRKIVRPQRAVLRDLERTKQRYLQEELEIYFDDISDAAERIWDTLENYKEVVEALESTNESVLSHRLNDSFRILTAVSVVLLPLTLIASIFGMNVHFPGFGTDLGFWLVIVMMFAVIVGMFGFFRLKRWL